MTKEQLKAEIRRKIYENTGGEITGQVLQDVLLNIADGTTDGGSGSGQDGVGISAITVSDIGSQVLASPSLMRAGGDMVLGASSSSGKKITIILTDGRRTSFNIYDGADGANGRDGKDGVDGANGEDGAAGPQGPAGRDGDTIGQEEIEEMYRRFDEYKTELSGRVTSIKEDLESGVAQDVMDALNDLGLTQQELESLRTRLTDAADKAQSALDLARSLSGITGSGITAEQLEEILSKNREVEAWMNEFSGKVGTLMSDYDELNQQVGAIGIGLDTANGKIGVLTNNINILSGTVGSVKSDWDASKGRLTDLATWYDSSASTYAELVRQMDGLNARIDDRISLMTPESIVGMDQYIDGKLAEFGRTIEVSGVDLTHIEERLNGLSGIVSTAITRYDGLSGSVTSIENSMNAMEGRLTTAMTIAQSAMTEATSMRETWNQESGMLRTVTDLVIKKDVNGDPIYWYVNPELEDPSDKSQWIRVYYQGEDPSTGLPYYTTQKNGGGTRYDSNVLPDYMSTMLSYIQQNSDSIEFTVTSGDVISALRLQVTEDGSKIILNSDMVEINSDVFAKSLQASGANIGGVWIGDGMISAQTGSNRWALTSDGKLTATNADIKGNITASTLTLGSQGIDAYIASKIPEGMDNGDVNALISSAANVNNWVVEEDLGDFVKMGVRIGNSVSSVTISKQGLLTAKNAIISGTVFANSGIFNGTVHANNGSFNGAITATSLTLGNQSIQDYISEQLPEGGVSTSDVNQLIASASNVNNWVVLEDLPDSVVLGTKYGSTSSVTISKNGLLTAKNAIISGTVFANSGVFNGTVHAKDGDFKGSVSATTGYFTNVQADSITIKNSSFSGTAYGDITANSLTLRANAANTIAQVAGEEIDSRNLPTSAVVKNYIDSCKFANSAATANYVDNKNKAVSAAVISWANQQGWVNESTVNSMIEEMGGSDMSIVSSTTSNGMTHYTATIGGKTYSWNSMEAEDYLILDSKLGTGSESNSGTAGFVVSKQGLLQAYNAVIYGTVYASQGRFKGDVYADNGYFNGTLMSTSGSIGGVKLSTIGLSIGSAFSLTTTSGLISHNATIYGSIRQPFGHLTQTGVNAAALRKYDNVYFDDNTESGVIVIDLSEEQETFGLSWDTSQIGRRITIVNNRGGKRITDYGYSKLTAPSGYYFFEDGIGTANLMFSNEIIELLGYGESDNNIFYGWIVMNRRNMMTKKRYGHELRLLATGTIKSGQSITNLTTFDGTAYMSYTQAMQQSTGSTSYYRNPNFSKISCTSNYIASNHYDYEVRLPNKWFYGASNIEKNMRVQLFSRTPGVYPAYISGNTSGFSYTTTNMLNYVAGDVDFYIYNMGDWDCLATDATIELTSDYYTWQVWDYDSSKSKNFNITVNPSTASITTGVTYGSQSPFTYSWNSSSKRLTATYNGNGGHQSVADTITITATAGSETASITIRCYYDVWVDPCNSDT